VSLIQLPTLLFFVFAHFFNQAMVVALDDVFEIGRAIVDEQHVKQKPEQVASRIDHAPVPVDFSQAIQIHGVAEIVVHA